MNSNLNTVVSPAADIEELNQRNALINLTVRAARAAEDLQPSQENALKLAMEAQYDKWPESFPEWEVLDEYFPRFRALQGCAHAFRYLLKSANQFRTNSREWWTGSMIPTPDILEIKVYGMCSKLAFAALKELAVYEYSILRDRAKWHPDDVLFKFGYTVEELNAEAVYRPADTYRAYGIALRFATEELGSFAARRALARLMLASPLPVDELENPEWVDPYTADLDGDYEYLKVKEPANEDVSSDGNLPTMVLDLMENMEYGNKFDFLLRLKEQGMTLDDYWLAFREAQRSGYSTVTEPEEEAEEEHDEYDVIEKDFQFQADLKITEAVEKIQEQMVLHGSTDLDLIAGLRAAVNSNAEFSKKNFQTRRDEVFQGLLEMYQQSEKREANEKQIAGFEAYQMVRDEMHKRFLDDPRTRAFLRRFQELIWKFPIQDMMSILLPFQNAFAFWEDDLYNIHCGQGWFTLAHWFNINGEEFLEQLNTREDVDYGDPEVNKRYGRRFVPQGEPRPEELDELARTVVSEQQALYTKGEEQRVQWAKEGRYPVLIIKAVRMLDMLVLHKIMGNPDADPKLYLMAADIHDLAEKGVSPIRLKDVTVPVWQTPKYKQDASWNTAYILAEVQTAVQGEGGRLSAQAAGWNAWRESIDPEANRVYGKLRKNGVAHKEAMAEFWKVVTSRKNRIVKVTDTGLVLGSGRKIDWTIAIMKLKAHEIQLARPDMVRLRDLLGKQGWGKPLFNYLSLELARTENK